MVGELRAGEMPRPFTGRLSAKVLTLKDSDASVGQANRRR
jgi:hypothetical protein